MTLTRTANRIQIALVALLWAATIFVAVGKTTKSAFAAIPVECPDGFQFNVPNGADVAKMIRERCANHQVNEGPEENVGTDAGDGGVRDYPDDITGCDNKDTIDECVSNTPIMGYVNDFIKILSAVVGLVVTGVIIFAGIRYSSAGGDPNKVAEAKKLITNAVVALVSYIFLIAFLSWVVPGGVL